jgi:hypothetical protein
MPEVSHFPVVPHSKAGVNCTGSIVPEAEGEHITLKFWSRRIEERSPEYLERA